MPRRSIVLGGLGIAAMVGATVAAPPAGADTTTTDVMRDGVTVSVAHVDGVAPTTDKHPLSRYDIDADGRDDILISGYPSSTLNPQAVMVRLSRTDAVERISGRDAQLSSGVVGDFDGDGFGDLAVGDGRGAAGAPGASGGVWVFYGGLSGFELGRTGHFTQATPGVPGDPIANGYFGSRLAAADFTGDGRADLVVALPVSTTDGIVLLEGSADGLTATGARQITGAQLKPSPGAVTGFGYGLVAGDVTGDGRPDLAVGSIDGRVFLLRGSATGPLTTAPSVFDALEASSLIANLGWLSLQSVADVNGDGIGDLITASYDAYVDGTSGVGAVTVFYGGADGLAAQRRTIVDRRWAGTPADSGELGFFGSCVSAGDVTGDGYADLVVGSWERIGAANMAGALYVFRGSAQGVRKDAVQVFTQDSPNVPGTVGDGHIFCGSAVLDLDGTGPLDLLATAPYDNVVARFIGGPSGLTADGALDTTQFAPGGIVTPFLSIDAAVAAPAGTASAAVAGRAATTAGTRAAVKPALTPFHPAKTGAARSIADSSTVSVAASFVPVSTAARFDFDGDGKDEAVVTTLQEVTVRYSRTGRIDVLTSPKWNTDIGQATAAGDFDHDGYADLAIGDPGDGPNDAMKRAGGVWVCRGSADGLLYDGCLHITQATPGIRGVVGTDSRFGVALAAGDFTGDGYADLAIGTPGEAAPNRLRRYTNAPPRFSSVGSVTLLYGGSDGIRPDRSQRLIPSVPAAYTYFGSALAAGDVTGDGIADLAVGASGVRGGSVDLFAGKPSGLGSTFTSRVNGTDFAATQSVGFGNALSIADTNADGKADVLVGAPYAEFGNPMSGAVFEFRGQGSGISVPAVRVLRPGAGGIPSVPNAGGFGYWIATGDANGDGYADLVVGVPFANPGNAANPPGMIMVLPGSAAGLTGTGLATATGPVATQSMGYSVGMLNSDGSGGLEVLAGAPFGDPRLSTKVGAYYEYRLSGSALTLVTTTTAAQIGGPSAGVYDFGFYALHQ